MQKHVVTTEADELHGVPGAYVVTVSTPASLPMSRGARQGMAVGVLAQALHAGYNDMLTAFDSDVVSVTTTDGGRHVVEYSFRPRHTVKAARTIKELAGAPK